MLKHAYELGAALALSELSEKRAGVGSLLAVPAVLGGVGAAAGLMGGNGRAGLDFRTDETHRGAALGVGTGVGYLGGKASKRLGGWWKVLYPAMGTAAGFAGANAYLNRDSHRSAIHRNLGIPI